MAIAAFRSDRRKHKIHSMDKFYLLKVDFECDKVRKVFPANGALEISQLVSSMSIPYCPSNCWTFHICIPQPRNSRRNAHLKHTVVVVPLDGSYFQKVFQCRRPVVVLPQFLSADI